jgi:hypothetical protein
MARCRHNNSISRHPAKLLMATKLPGVGLSPPCRLLFLCDPFASVVRFIEEATVDLTCCGGSGSHHPSMRNQQWCHASFVNEATRDSDKRNPAATRVVVDACFASADHVEGRTAFFEKRKPAFRGRLDSRQRDCIIAEQLMASLRINP